MHAKVILENRSSRFQQHDNLSQVVHMLRKTTSTTSDYDIKKSVGDGIRTRAQRPVPKTGALDHSATPTRTRGRRKTYDLRPKMPQTLEPRTPSAVLYELL